jgi:hypothetical protein
MTLRPARGLFAALVVMDHSGLLEFLLPMISSYRIFATTLILRAQNRALVVGAAFRRNVFR